MVEFTGEFFMVDTPVDCKQTWSKLCQRLISLVSDLHVTKAVDTYTGVDQLDRNVQAVVARGYQMLGVERRYISDVDVAERTQQWLVYCQGKTNEANTRGMRVFYVENKTISASELVKMHQKQDVQLLMDKHAVETVSTDELNNLRLLTGKTLADCNSLQLLLETIQIALG